MLPPTCLICFIIIIVVLIFIVGYFIPFYFCIILSASVMKCFNPVSTMC